RTSRARSTSAASGWWTRPTWTWRSTGPPPLPGRPACRSRSARSGTPPNSDLEMAAVGHAEIGAVFRAEYGRAVAVLTRVFGSIDLAEDAVQEAFTAAAGRWPETGLPPSPAGWIITTARNRAIDRIRRESSRDERQAEAMRLHAPA